MGYLNNPAQTQERFITGRSGEGRLYRTGDRGQYLPDGNIEILGREDAQVKIRGHRVELGEIEAALEKHPSIDHAVVAVRGRGGEQRRLVAFAQSVTVPLLLPGDVAGRAAEASAAFLSGEHVGGFSEYTRMLDRAALASIMDCFRAAGLFTGDDGHKLEDIFRSLQARSGFHRLVRRWLNAAVNDGFLIREGDAYRASAEASALHAPMEWKRIEQLTPRFDSPLLLEYFRNSGESLLLLIRSKRAAFDMLYPHGRPDISISLHEHSLLNRWGNIVAAAMARHIAESANLDGPLRVLEIGGGVGGTTASILSVLPGPYEYWFTDVSQYFLNHARERFAGNRSLHFSIYDINRSYQEQGLPPNTFDIIVAGDVLHVARHVPRLLSELRELLRPGGWLLALEMTRDHYQIMTTLELLNTDENGSVYEDSRQHRDQTFYTRDEWLQLFEASHADTVAMIPAHDGAFFEAGLCIAAARYKADRAAVDPEALAKFLRDRLPDYMAPAEIRLLDQLPLTPNGKVNRKLLTEWASIEPAAATEIIPFDSDLEADLGAIWSSVLGLAAVDRSLDFLAAGGDSLLAAQLTGRIIEEIPIARDIFFDDLLRRVLEGPTLPELARILQRTANPGEGSDDTIDSNILVPLGGAHYPTACVVIREAGTTLAGCSVQAEALTSRMCLYEAEIERDEEVLPVLAERCVRILRRGGARGVHLVGYGQGNLLAVELARQMLDAGDPLLSVTVTSLAGYREHLAPSVDVLAYAGDLNLLCRESQTDNGVEDFWRSVCLGNFRVRRLKTTSPESVTEGLLEILGE
jgi:pyochelin synthetase